MQAPSAKAALTDFRDRLGAATESVLLVDYDGTLAPFQTERDQAYPYPGVVPILESILQCGRTRVIVITGRPIRELQTLFRPSNSLEVWGAHGMEHKLADGTYQQTAIAPATTAILAQAEKWLIAAGLASLAEIKPGGIAIHWRGLPDVEIERMQARAREGWAAFAEEPGLKLLNFETGLELRVAHPDKGDVVAAILEDLDPHAPIAFFGDDLTDEDAFRVLGDRGLSVLVRPEYRETRAKVWLKPPHELIVFFEQWLNSISA
ncbi:MAG TPA: trehalose-phosphatase [Acidobacteriaceae bacterium]|nr:trehalose-phosphatase [Acidobacteriaceae bacterium]